MIQYIKPRIDQSDEIANIHLKSFPNFFLTTLGYSFLKTYYKSCSKSKEAISICAIDEETKKIVGFAVGCLNSKGFNKRLIYSNFWAYFYQILILLFTKPLALIRLFKNLGKGNISDDKGDYAELLSIGVSPDRSGLGIGRNLLAEFEIQVKEKSINTITLTTDRDSNYNVIKFYKKSGYKTYYNFVSFPNRNMIKLKKNIK
ncbi:GNAT family N-acetyltransferase [Polaribacter sp.]|uniref:GNAT family N-acetyltransferase n=1 Tax=Polaribacter sp. TaxID=1920175 RepID=UPI003F6A2175